MICTPTFAQGTWSSQCEKDDSLPVKEETNAGNLSLVAKLLRWSSLLRKANLKY